MTDNNWAPITLQWPPITLEHAAVGRDLGIYSGKGRERRTVPALTQCYGTVRAGICSRCILGPLQSLRSQVKTSFADPHQGILFIVYLRHKHQVSGDAYDLIMYLDILHLGQEAETQR